MLFGGKILCLLFNGKIKKKKISKGASTRSYTSLYIYLPRTFVRVRPSQRRTRTKVRACVRVRRPTTVLDLLYVVHVYEVQEKTSLIYS